MIRSTAGMASRTPGSHRARESADRRGMIPRTAGMASRIPGSPRARISRTARHARPYPRHASRAETARPPRHAPSTPGRCHVRELTNRRGMRRAAQLTVPDATLLACPPNGLGISDAATDRSGKRSTRYQPSKKLRSWGREAASAACPCWTATVVAHTRASQDILAASVSG